MSHYEGSHASKLVQLISDIGYNKDVDFELGTVLSPFPSIEIQVDGLKYTLDATDMVIAEHLADSTRTVTIEALGLTDGVMTIKSPLQVGDRVILASFKNDQYYILLDKAVTN